MLAPSRHVGDLISERRPVHALGEVVTGVRDGQLRGFGIHDFTMARFANLASSVCASVFEVAEKATGMLWRVYLRRACLGVTGLTL